LVSGLGLVLHCPHLMSESSSLLTLWLRRLWPGLLSLLRRRLGVSTYPRPCLFISAD
jgi:hypothetical protein